MEIKRGKLIRGVKAVFCGPEGIGKSTMASHIPGVVFIDTEGSTSELDVPRMPAPSSWEMLKNEVQYAVDHPDEVPALCIDTADWAERLCLTHVLNTKLINGQPANGIEAYGYGKGYQYLYEEFGKLLDLMEIMSQHGQHVGFCAHTMMRKFEQPDETGSYDRWELKMSKKVAPLVKEWASLMLFMNYKTYVYATDDKGKKHKASGGQRVMYTTHHPCWDAKNRYGLAEELPMDFSAIAHLFVPAGQASVPAKKDVSEKKSVVTQAAVVPPVDKAPQTMEEVLDSAGPIEGVPSAESEKTELEQRVDNAVAQNVDYTGVPAALVDLMKADKITPFEVRSAIASKGYFPLETRFENYPADFVQGVLIGAWDQVRDVVFNNRNKKPF